MRGLAWVVMAISALAILLSAITVGVIILRRYETAHAAQQVTHSLQPVCAQHPMYC